jgi:hypothetical protein
VKGKSGVLQNIVLFFKKALFLAPDESNSLLPALVTGGLLSFLWGMLLIGIPGALLMVAFKWLFSKLGIPTAPDTQATWGVVILVSLAMPLTIPAAHFLAKFGFPKTFMALSMFTGAWWIVLGICSAFANAK